MSSFGTQIRPPWKTMAELWCKIATFFNAIWTKSTRHFTQRPPTTHYSMKNTLMRIIWRQREN